MNLIINNKFIKTNKFTKYGYSDNEWMVDMEIQICDDHSPLLQNKLDYYSLKRIRYIPKILPLKLTNQLLLKIILRYKNTPHKCYWGWENLNKLLLIKLW